MLPRCMGGLRFLSRKGAGGGGGFAGFLKKLSSNFFQVEQIDFLSSPKQGVSNVLLGFFCTFWEKGVFRHAFLSRAVPTQN